MSTINSDDNKRSLVLFARDCGATTSTSIQLSIHNKGVNLDEAETGNIFIADGRPTLESYAHDVSAKWISKDAVDVQFDHHLRVFKQDTVWSGTHIRYLSK